MASLTSADVGSAAEYRSFSNATRAVEPFEGEGAARSMSSAAVSLGDRPRPDPARVSSNLRNARVTGPPPRETAAGEGAGIRRGLRRRNASQTPAPTTATIAAYRT